MLREILVTGVGRCGTSVLMAIFTRLGLDTGFNEDDIKEIFDMPYNAGLEDFHKQSRIIKRPSPANPGSLFSTDNYKNVIICVRELFKCSESRIRVSDLGYEAGGRSRPHENISNLSQHDFDAKLFGEMMSYIALNDVPHFFLKFPDFIYDFGYFYNTIKDNTDLFDGISIDIAMEVFENTVKKELVHI